MQSAFRLNALSSALKNLHTRQIDATSLPGNKIQAAALACALLMPGMALAETPSTPKETTLSTVKVEESSDNTAQDTGYQATRTRVGKVLQDPQDIPQAVTTITHQLMEDQQVGSLREALRNVSGLTFNASEGGRSGDNMMLRGFYTFGDIYLDGIRDTAQYNRETFSLEQIDVLRGAAAMLYGRGQAGGVINQVSKMPLLTDKYKLTGSLGTDDYREVTADLNKKISEHAAMRVNLMKRDEGSWRSNPADGAQPELHRSGVAASLGLGLNTDNELTFNHMYLRTRDNPDYGVSFSPITKRPTTTFPSSYFWGTNGTFDDSDTNISTVAYTHKFSPDTQLRTQIRYADYQRAYWAITPSPTLAPTAAGKTGPTRKSHNKDLVVQSDFTTKLKLLGMQHELLAGIEYLREDASRASLVNLGSATAPIYSTDVLGTPITYHGDTHALYLQDTIEFVPKWKLTAGIRRDELKATYSSLTSPQLDFGQNSYRSGISYQPNEAAHYYVSYSDSFSPTADLYQLSGSTYPPERSQVAELGAKWLFFDGDLAFRTALYRAEKEYERNTDLESTASILTNKRRTDGIEFELAGRVTPNWEVFSGLAFMDATILQPAQNRNANTGVITYADPRYAGQRARNTPTYTFNFFTTYKLGGGWKIGGGVEAKGARYGYNPTAANGPFVNGAFDPNTAPAYQRWDALVAYEQKSWALRLNIKNVFDKVYYDAIYDNGPFTIPGNRRAAILTGELKF